MTTEIKDDLDDLFEMLNHRPGCDSAEPTTFVGFVGDLMLCCRTCRVAVPIKALRRQHEKRGDEDVSRGRFALVCVRCDRSIRLHSPKPRVPLCATCKSSHSQRKTNQ